MKDSKSSIATKRDRRTGNNSESRNNVEKSAIAPSLIIRISFRTNGAPTALLSLKGTLTNASLRLLTSALNECATQKKNTIIIDLTDVTSINKAGWNTLFYEKKRLKLKEIEIFIFGLNSDLEADFLRIHKKSDDLPKIFKSITECQKEIEFYEEYISTHRNEHPSSLPVYKQHLTEQPHLSYVPEPAQDVNTNKKPLSEKITSIIAKYGPCSTFEILSYLKSDEFDNTDINILQLTRQLSEMDLSSWEKRERYYRSC